MDKSNSSSLFLYYWNFKANPLQLLAMMVVLMIIDHWYSLFIFDHDDPHISAIVPKSLLSQVLERAVQALLEHNVYYTLVHNVNYGLVHNVYYTLVHNLYFTLVHIGTHSHRAIIIIKVIIFILATVIIIIMKATSIIIVITRPRPAFGRLGLGGSSGGYSSCG